MERYISVQLVALTVTVQTVYLVSFLTIKQENVWNVRLRTVGNVIIVTIETNLIVLGAVQDTI